jgi:hypothetical protein
MNNGSIEDKTTNRFENTNEEKKNNMEHSQQKTNNPHNDRQRTIAQTEGKKEGKRERRKDSTGTVGGLQLSTSIECDSLSFPTHAHVAAPSRILISYVFPFERSRSYYVSRGKGRMGREM